MAFSPPLYWKSQPTHAVGIDLEDALLAAKTVLQNSGLTNITLSNVDVSGRTPETHAAITFLWTGDQLTAIIMVAGSDNTSTHAVLNELSEGLNKLAWL